ncbi:MAG: hypothetical protein M3Z14_06940 [Candidatus Eremiobacteraeota bacterium]|nr:hypothetical protein [Candidatus Eremiobacteraeota bacterium]
MIVHFLLAFLAQTTPLPTPSETPSPSPTPIYEGNPAAQMRLEQRPLAVDPDGNARWLVIVRFLDANGKPTRIMKNSDLDYKQSRGQLQWQTRMRYGSPAVIVKTPQEGPLAITVRANVPSLPAATAQTDTRRWFGPRVIARALGPSMVQIGWFPREEKSTVRIFRIDANGSQRSIAVMPAPSSAFRDTSVLPNRNYRYIVKRGTSITAVPAVRTFSGLPATSVAAASGKAMWLFFSTNPYDDNYYAKIDPQRIVAQAVKAGLHYVELRTAYGEYWQITPEARPTIDAIIDGLAIHHIGVIGWTVPRQATYADLLMSVKTAYYRTSRGTRFTALALDLERGEEFMHDCPEGCIAIADYSRRLREALGNRYTIVATIEDPYLEHLDESKYPYRAIARYSDVLQPMSYWRMLAKKSTSVDQMKALLRGSVQKVRALSKRTLPISIGGQTSKEGPRGFPPADEVFGSLEITRRLGAIGECFFDWDGTQPYQWDAISRYRW